MVDTKTQPDDGNRIHDWTHGDSTDDDGQCTTSTHYLAGVDDSDSDSDLPDVVDMPTNSDLESEETTTQVRTSQVQSSENV